MRKLCTLSCLALATALLVLCWGLGGGFAVATQEPQPVDDTALGGSPGTPELTAAPSSGSRALPAALAAAPATLAASGPPTRRERVRPAATAVRSTPLYLSHCTFLC